MKKMHAALNSMSNFIEKIEMYISTIVVYLFSYDSVDKAVLDAPHKIKRIDLTVKKGNRDTQSVGITLSPANRVPLNPIDGTPKKSNIKQVQIGTLSVFTYYLCLRYSIMYFC